VFDANTDGTRKKFGLIPTATALSHYSKYEASELPASKDTKLVFYCSNESCGASHTAAEKAIIAGYDDVHVLPAGVMGWKDAGKDTKTYQN
jgi:rhodanese-related sulfurtransferase